MILQNSLSISIILIHLNTFCYVQWAVIQWRLSFFPLQPVPQGILQPLIRGEFQQERNWVKTSKDWEHQGKEQLLHSCEKVPGWPEKGITLFLAVTHAGDSRKLSWMRQEGSSESEQPLPLFISQVKHLMYWLLLCGVCSQLCFTLPKIPGEVSSCVRLEMLCSMQESGKKSKPLAYGPRSWHRLRLWASHNCLGTAVLFCWRVICLQQCADWACLSIVALILPLLCPVEHFCISVVDHSS